MAALTNRHLSESELTRTRHRLVRRKMITEGPGEHGSKVYSITEAGRVRLGQIRILMDVAPQLETPDTAKSDLPGPRENGHNDRR